MRADSVRLVVGPASGPKWLALAGLDRALLDAGLVGPPPTGGSRLEVGASAGAWRMLAFAARDPAATHERLARAYIHRRFPKGARPAVISAAYREMLSEVFPEPDVHAICSRPGLTTGVHIARLRGALPWRLRLLQLAALGAAAILHRISSRATDLLAERLLALTRPERVGSGFDGPLVALTRENLLPAALASGTVPVYMEPVRGLPGAPDGDYVDGGLSDYHLRRSFLSPGEGIVLFPHFQERIDAVWLDGRGPARPPREETVADVLQIFPSPAFVATLPGGRLPDRDDFFRHADAPEERIRRWTETLERSSALGEAFARDLESGDWIGRLEPIRTA